jgi:ferredoxin-thioredoxin reductase catalytic subunit
MNEIDIDQEKAALRNRVQSWLDAHPERGYAFSSHSEKIIESTVKKKLQLKSDTYACPCRVKMDGDDEKARKYNDNIDCRPCIYVRDEDLAKDGIDKNGHCHCRLLVLARPF